MSRWREVAAAARRPCDPQSPRQGTDWGLPDDLAQNLHRFRGMGPPARSVDSAAWREVVADAIRIADDGWARSALALGWTAHDLFGIGPRDSWEFSGLAVWLAGRPIVALDADRAIAREQRGRAFFNRGGMGHGAHPAIDPVLLWQFGRG